METKPGRKGARTREVKKTDTRNTILTNFPSWNRLVAYAEWTEFCEIDQMKKMNVFILFIYFFMQ